MADSAASTPYINSLIFVLIALFVTVTVVLIVLANEFPNFIILLVTVVAGMLGVSIFTAAAIVNEKTVGSGADTSKKLVVAKCPDYYTASTDTSGLSTCTSDITLTSDVRYRLLHAVRSAGSGGCTLEDVKNPVTIASPGHGRTQPINTFCDTVRAAGATPWVNAHVRCR